MSEDEAFGSSCDGVLRRLEAITGGLLLLFEPTPIADDDDEVVAVVEVEVEEEEVTLIEDDGMMTLFMLSWDPPPNLAALLGVTTRATNEVGPPKPLPLPPPDEIEQSEHTWEAPNPPNRCRL